MSSTSTGLPHHAAHWRHALLILGGATVVRLLLAAAVPLFADEAYYWEWSRRLAGGYFDHPPAIAVLIAAGTAVLGDTPLGVRLLPVLAGTLAGYWLMATARHLAGATAARFAAALCAVIPLSAAGFVLATPDAPLLAAISGTLFALVRALEGGNAAMLTAGEPILIADDTRLAGLGWWVAAGGAIGVAMASKYTAVLVPAAAALAVTLHPGLRGQLRSPGPWLAVGLASLVMAPVLFWNAHHGWISFRFQLGHGLGTAARGTWWQRELDLLGGQFGLMTPILFVLALAAVRRALQPKGDAPRFTLAVIATIGLAFFVYSATRRSVEANWPAIGWLPAILLLAASRAGTRSVWERRGTWLAGILTALALLHVVVPYLPLPARRDPVSKAHGWERLAGAMDSARAALGGDVHLAANRYQDAAFLAFHMADRPTVYSPNLGGRRNQYDVWPRYVDVATPGGTLLIALDEPREGLPTAIRMLDGHFAARRAGPLVAITRGADTLATRRLWVLHDWAGTWPDDPSDPLPRQ